MTDRTYWKFGDIVAVVSRDGFYPMDSRRWMVVGFRNGRANGWSLLPIHGDGVPVRFAEISHWPNLNGFIRVEAAE